MQEAYATSLPAVIRGEEAFQAARRQKRNAALLGAAVVLVCLLVAAWITGAYWFTSSTSVANPAVGIGRMFSDSFAGIAPESMPMFAVMQIMGGVIGLLIIKTLWADNGANS